MHKYMWPLNHIETLKYLITDQTSVRISLHIFHHIYYHLGLVRSEPEVLPKTFDSKIKSLIQKSRVRC